MQWILFRPRVEFDAAVVEDSCGLDTLLTMRPERISMQDFIVKVMRLTGTRVVVEGNPSGTVTGSFIRQKAREILSTVLSECGYTWYQDEQGVVRVHPVRTGATSAATSSAAAATPTRKPPTPTSKPAPPRSTTPRVPSEPGQPPQLDN